MSPRASMPTILLFAVCVDDGQPPDPFAFHDARRTLGLVGVAAPNHTLGHHVSCCELGYVVAVCDASHRDVAISDHPNESVVLADRDGTDVVLSHLLCKRPDWCTR